MQPPPAPAFEGLLEYSKRKCHFCDSKILSAKREKREKRETDAISLSIKEIKETRFLTIIDHKANFYLITNQLVVQSLFKTKANTCLHARAHTLAKLPLKTNFSRRYAMFYHMSTLKECVKHMPRDIEKNNQERLMYVYKYIVQLLAHLDEVKKEKDKAKRENAQPIVEEIEKVLRKYRAKENID